MTIKLRTLIIIVVSLISLIGGGYTYYTNRISTLKNTIDGEVKLKNALVDSVKYYRNGRDELVAERLTLQGNIGTLKSANNKLSISQKELLSRIESLKKDGKVIAAALVETKVQLDSFRNIKPIIDTIKNTVQFKDSSRYYRYDIGILNVKPMVGKNTTILSLNNLELFNKQFIEFHWKDERKNGYPVSFSVSNDNPYFKTANIDSYIIPEVNQNQLKPKFFKRIGIFFQKNKDFILVPAAVVLGVLLSSVPL